MGTHSGLSAVMTPNLGSQHNVESKHFVGEKNNECMNREIQRAHLESKTKLPTKQYRLFTQ